MEPKISHDVTATQKGAVVDLCDVIYAAAGSLLLWLLITLTVCRLILAYVFEHCLLLGRWLLARILDRVNLTLRILSLNVYYWIRHEASPGTALRDRTYRVIRTVAFMTAAVVRCGCVWTRSALGLIPSATTRGRCRLFSRLASTPERPSTDTWESCAHGRRLVFCPFSLLYWTAHRLYNFSVGKLQSRYPAAFEATTWLAGEVSAKVLNFARSVCSGLSSLASKSVATARITLCLLSCVYIWLSSSLASSVERFDLFLGEGPQFAKNKSRCSVSLLCWRMFHLRSCSPRFSFIAILVVVSVFLSACLYVSHVNSVSKLTKFSQYPEGDADNGSRNNLGSKVSAEYKKNRQRNRWKEKMLHNNDSEEEMSTVSWKHMSDFISLMGKHHWQNRTLTPLVNMEELLSQIHYLREEMISEKTMLPKLADPPACTGDLAENEVEDLLCIPKPKYLSHIKNPCWYSEDSGADNQAEKKLSCLPYFHILGCAKAGTTDLWNRLLSHPHIIANDGLLHKEALWWSWRRYGYTGYSRREVMNFSEYVDLFQDTARIIESSIENENLLHQIIITGDASPPDFWDFRGWTNVSQNRNASSPHVITPHLMKHLYRNPKFILMFRDPIDRLYSDYFFVGGGLTSLDFHNDVLVAIQMVYNCIRQFGLLHCFYDHKLYVNLPVRLPFACYSVFMREWLQVFSLESFLLIKTEDYQTNPEKTLKDVMEFLGL
ncbi:Carbohydrate sulfotransferase 15, partial [Bulinus truncatus]